MSFSAAVAYPPRKTARRWRNAWAADSAAVPTAAYSLTPRPTSAPALLQPHHCSFLHRLLRGLLRCSLLRCSFLRCSFLRCSFLRCSFLRCSFLRCSFLRCSFL